MNILDEINNQPRGIQRELAHAAGVSEATISRCLRRIYCHSRSAKKIAAAYGQPDAWPDLVTEKTTKKAPNDRGL